ncbi:hypothetical protein EXIGLDRAFT_797301 [Exidia glandulosa HHB12029]|uniref:Peptidase M48 domain-containing protein n=1 Tax=Exidia glandulosa HHB12029 TaxID=1314781 RepID=A0A165FHF1_EXIGL|nr:hypothetical protein EXIGLDRAFT_797301 [Exidia glandulosa HHB12029]
MHANQKRFYSIQRVSVYVNVEPGTSTPNSVGIGINGPGGVRFTTLSISTRPTPIRRPVSGGDCVQIQKRTFKATSKCEGAPLFVWLAGALKSSSALGLVHTITRVAMTLVPFTLIKLKLVSKFLTKLPAEDPKRAKLTHQLHVSRKLIIALFVVPASVFWAALMASLERTPLTGRWRLILMSPQEEDDVSKQLQGPGWYNAVADILLSNSEGKMPKVVPVSDWRYKWVDETLRQLESFLPVFRDEAAYAETFAQQRTFPTPPPSRFPLVPRPRISQLLHCFLSESSINAVLGSPKEKDADVDAAHSILGPPYNLLLVDKPDTSNGFSYGFGGHGAAGIVVFSGFLDEILQSTTMQAPAPTPSPPALQEKNGWSSYLGLGTAPVPAQAPDPVPTAEQTAQLAVLLAHEISHLMLAHHLETLSNSTIFAPGVLGIFGDVFRTILFPLTMLFGPFVNDAVANMTKVSRSEILEGHEACFNRKLEIEADIVSARILAYAGFDPRIAVEFWESRLGPADHAHDKKPKHTGAGHFWRGGSSKKRDTHPVREERIQRLKAELARWEAEWKPRLSLKNLSPSPST